MLIDRGRRLLRWTSFQFGALYFRVVAVGGSAAVVFLAIWPLSTVVVVLLVAAVMPLLATVRGTRSAPASSTEGFDPPLEPTTGGPPQGGGQDRRR